MGGFAATRSVLKRYTGYDHGMPESFLIFVVVSVATARLTRLVVDDKITETARHAVVKRLGADSRISYLVNCHWCTGVWAAAVVNTAAAACDMTRGGVVGWGIGTMAAAFAAVAAIKAAER